MSGNYANKFGLTNILTNEERESYRAFAQRVHNMDHKELFLLHGNMLDSLTSEQQDIVAWEIKSREIDILRKQNIDPNAEYNYEAVHDRNTKDITVDFNTQQGVKYYQEERNQLSEMTDELLERSRQIIENADVVISSSKLHDKNGGGINMLAHNYVVEDANGKRIRVNNKQLQDHYRKLYVKKMSEVTGIDYTKYDPAFAEDDIHYFDPVDPSRNPPPDNDSINIRDHEIMIDEYEDDDDY